MSNPTYDVMEGYATLLTGGGIVKAVPTDDYRLGLTGLVVEVDPDRWMGIDHLEGGYQRIKVKTLLDVECWMYAGK